MAAVLKAEGLSKNFGGLMAVNRVNFHVLEGQTAGLIGPNGSGKTTLFNLLSGHLPPSEGRIRFLARDITGTQPHLRVVMGMARTFQLVSVFNSLTVWENLVLSSIRFQRAEHAWGNFFFKPAQKEEILDGCRRSLAEVGLESKGGKKTSELSYGEKRMVELAMALALKPTLLLLDEPLSGLSDHEITGVVGLLHRVKKNFSMVIIEHKISKIVGLVERLSVMNDGHIICEGQPGQVLTDAKVRECYWGGGV